MKQTGINRIPKSVRDLMENEGLSYFKASQKHKRNVEAAKKAKQRSFENGNPTIKQVDNKRQKLEKAIWVECRRIVRARFPNVCYTCGKIGLQGKDWQTGHGYAKSLLSISHKYDLRNLRPQCQSCNNYKMGKEMTSHFIFKLAQEETPETMAELFYSKNRDSGMSSIQATLFLRSLLETYKTIEK